MDPEEIAHGMNGLLQTASPGRMEALLPSPMIQNHAAFLHLLSDGALACAWFGGTLEGKSDISIFASVLPKDATQWGPPQRLSFDAAHSEQNPVLFTAPDGRLWLFHTSQPSGNQDECRIRMAEVRRDASDPLALTTTEGRYLELPAAVSSARRSWSAAMAHGCCRSSAAFSALARSGTEATIRQPSASRSTTA